MQKRLLTLSVGEFLTVLFCAVCMAVFGCDDVPVGKAMDIVLPPDEDVIMPIGEMKTDDALNGVQDTDALVVPNVLEISYYSDIHLTEPLDGAIVSGMTVYTKVVFSEDVSIVIADDVTAWPPFFYGVGLKSAQYSMKPRRTNDQNLHSGDAKPHQDTNHSFVCKYVTQPDDVGEGFITYVDDGEWYGEVVEVTSPTDRELLKWQERYQDVDDWAVMRPPKDLSQPSVRLVYFLPNDRSV